MQTVGEAVTFVKGQPRPANGGRKPGSKNKKRIARVAEYLAERDINPAEQVIAILDAKDEDGNFVLKHPKDRADLWLDLLSYCQAKPKAVEEVAESDDEPDEDLEGLTNDQILKILKMPTKTPTGAS